MTEKLRPQTYYPQSLWPWQPGDPPDRPSVDGYPPPPPLRQRRRELTVRLLLGEFDDD